MMADAERAGATLIYRNVDFNTYGFLNATEAFLEEEPELAQTVVDAYEKARAWAIENPEETAAILAEVAGVDRGRRRRSSPSAPTSTSTPCPGDAQIDGAREHRPDLRRAPATSPTQEQVDEALGALFDDEFADARPTPSQRAAAEG